MSDLNESSQKYFIPKTPTEQDKFLKKYPDYDGRGTLIAIIDSCVDVSLPGLQKTSTGLPKIVDCFDFTENGNVDTSTVKEIEIGSNLLTGLTGRKLKIPKSWINPSGKWHLGIKPIYELFDEVALERIIEIRRESISKENEILKDTFQPTIENSEDSKIFLEYLQSTENLSKDSLVADCIVWNDGKQWKACIDTSFVGDLKSVKVLTNYRDNHEFDLIFGEFAYCVTIHENGNLLEIFVPFKNHGSVVANVAAAHYPNDPEMDGLAPGAQIISMSVMDIRNNGKLNDNAAIKAFQKCLELKVDVINYSIAGFPEAVDPIIKELVENHGVIIFKSAGNDGPIHSLIFDMPSEVFNLVFVIGACETSIEQENLHKNENYSNPPKVSTFSSRGPTCINGSCGVTFLAPGNGIIETPKHYSNKKPDNKFNGTSVASPNAAGAVACLISGLKANGISLTPFKLRTSLANTALIPKEDNSLAFGNGIIQIYKAFEYFRTDLKNFLEKIKNISFILSSSENDRFLNKFVQKSFNQKPNFANGIFLKLRNEENVYNFGVKVVVETYSNEDPTNISWKLKLLSPAENFVTLRKEIIFNEFSLKIDSSRLKPNSINYAEIHGMDISNPSWGILFKFPVTVIVPKRIHEDERILETLNFTISNEIHRFFFIPPSKSRQCIMQITSLNEKDATLKFHYFSENAQIGDEKTEEIEFKNDKKQKTGCLQLDDEEENCAFEICIYQEKESRQCSKFNLEFEFLGFAKIDPFRLLNNFNNLSYLPSCIFKQRLQFRNDLSKIKYTSMSLKFDRIAFQLKARNVRYETLGENQYLNLEYSLTVSKESKYKFTLITFGPDYLSEVYSFKRIQIYTLSKKYLSAIGEWEGNTITLQPGIYVIKAVFEYQPSKPFYMQILSSIEKFPEISVKMFFEEPLIATFNFDDDKDMVIDKNETMTVDYDLIFDNDVVMPASLPFVSTFKGEFSLKLENTSIDIKVKHKYYNFERIANETSGFKELCQSYLPYCTNIKNLYNNMDQEETSKWQKNIRSNYLTQNCTKLVETVDAFLEKINYKDFLENYDQIITDANEFEKKLFKQQKMIIIEALFLKADMVLNECLKKNTNVSEIFDNKFGNEIISNQILNNTVSKMQQFSIYDILPRLFPYSIFPVRDLSTSYNNSHFLINDENHPKIREHQDENADEDVENPQIQNLHFIKTACKDFFDANLDGQEDIQKDLIVIKQAVMLGNFGTALFHLNKLSTENQTLPEFKIFDQAIIELLKHLHLKHLLAAHENAFLDRHRSNFRKF